MLRLELNHTEQMDLQLEARRAIGRVSERIHFVLLSAQGYTPPEIGELMGYHAASVRMWLKAYHAGGVAALADAPRSGRPRSDPHLDDVVETQVGQPPIIFGYLQSIWTVAMLASHIAQFGIRVSASTVRRALKRLRFIWHRPKLAPARRRDPQREAKEARLWAIWQDAMAHLVVIDECDIHLLPPVRAMWQRIGQQLRLPTPGQNAKRPVFGGLDVRTGQWFYRLADHKRTADFIDFLTDILAAYPVGVIYIILDNASIHSSQELLKWLEANTRLQLAYLPTYSGHRLNPVEKVWWCFKGFIAANRCVRSRAELDAVSGQWFNQLNPAERLTLTGGYIARLANLPAPQNVDKTFSD
jgi:transposase